MVPTLKALILAVLLALTLAAASGADGTGANRARWIVFSAGPDGGNEPEEIFRVRTNGTGLQQVTHSPWSSVEPSFAPDGSRVLFARPLYGIFVVNLDGSGQRRLTVGGHPRYPVFSPNGTRIAYLRGDQVYVKGVDSGRPRRLLRAPAGAGRLSWTPDGKSIAFPAGRDPRNDLFFYTVDARSGRIQRRLALKENYEPIYTEAKLSPNGRVVAFIGRRLEPPDCEDDSCWVYSVYLKRSSGGRLRRVADDAGAPSWSSDGRTLIYPYRRAIRLHQLQDGTRKTIRIGKANLSGAGTPALQPR